MHPNFYSFYSNIDRYHLDKKYSLDVINAFKKVIKILDYDAENGILEKKIYNDFHYIEYINYIPLETVSNIILHQFRTYIKTVPFSNLKLYINAYYSTFLYECEFLLHFIEKGKLTWWDSHENFDFYTFSASMYEYKMIVWQSYSDNDLHFYELYLKSLIQLLNHDLVEQFNESNLTNLKLNDNLEPIKLNKNLLFNGKTLNLLERYQIANKVLDIEKKINTLNITKDKKNELLSYILDCNIDTAKKLLNGTYDAKPRNLESYFKDLDLNK